MTGVCPCCGQLSESAPPFFVDEDNSAILVDGKSIGLSPLQVKLLAIMARKYPHTATKAGILEVLYGDDPNGGPEYADRIVLIYIHTIRKKLKGTSLSIETIWGVGYKFVYDDQGTSNG